MNLVATLYYLLILRKNRFMNSLTKVDTWIKIVSLLFVLYIFINSVQSSVFLVDVIETKFSRHTEYQAALFNIIFFMIFALNVFTIFFMGNSDNYLSKSTALRRMPISIKVSVLCDIIAGVGEVFNVVFIPLYFSVYFLVGNVFTIGNIFLFSAIFILFIIFISNTIYLLVGLSTLFVPYKHKALIALLGGVLIFVLLTVFINQSSLLTKGSIIGIGSFLTIFPTGVFIYVSQSLAENNFFLTFVIIFFYFTLINILFFVLNVILIKKNVKAPILPFINRRKKSFWSKISINPLLRKNVLYFLRSPKMIVNSFLFFVFYVITLISSLSSESIDVSSDKTLLLIITFISVHVVSVLISGGNVFGHEFSAVINYFFAPISLQRVLVAKIFIPIGYAVINFLISVVVLIYFHISLLDFLLYWSLVLLITLIFVLLGLVFSIYLPRTISFTALNGLNTSLITAILSLILALLVAGGSAIILSITSRVIKIAVVVVLLVIGLTLLFYFKSIIYNISKLFVNRKKRLIEICQKEY